MISRSLAAQKYPEIFEYNKHSETLNVFVDNHILASLRKCEAFFYESIVKSLVPRGESRWNLDFGIWYHKVMEHFYEAQVTNKPVTQKELLEYATHTWITMEMDAKYKDKAYQHKKMCGLLGALSLIVHFTKIFTDGEGNNNTRFKIITTEVSFGRGREVPILDWTSPSWDSSLTSGVNKYELQMYLCGRPDVLVDNGLSIGPLDFKTTTRFTGKESMNYKPYDALTGYVYAVNMLFKDKLRMQGRTCDKAFVLCASKDISVKLNDDGSFDDTNSRDKFKLFPISYTKSELEEYRMRQISSINRLYELLVLEEMPQWNTQLCNNDWYHDCIYKELHSQPPEVRAILEKQSYIQVQRWNPVERKDEF